MPRPIHALIHTEALRHNLAQARRRAADARLWAIVKANAYGHGIERAFDGLRAADGFALLDLYEAARLRDLGWRGPILLLEGVFDPRDLEVCSRLDLWHVVHCDAQIDMLAAHKTQQPHRVFLKMNSGMNRLGFKPARYRAAWMRLDALPQVGEVSLMTHFSDADGPRGIAEQMAVFAAVTADLPGERSLSNSAALLRHADAEVLTDAGPVPVTADWVRPGIAVYGSAPDYPAHGIAACGYADGYPRLCPTGTPVLVEGVRCRTVGRVSMDMLAVDLEPVPHAGLGSEVTLWGRSRSGAILPIDEVAVAAGTVGYELMCALAPRVGARAEP
jgi:alanine racemase